MGRWPQDRRLLHDGAAHRGRGRCAACRPCRDLLRVLGMELMLVPRALKRGTCRALCGRRPPDRPAVGVEAPPSAVEQLRRQPA